MKVADITLSWTRSVSSSVTSRTVEVTQNGEVTTVDVGPEVSSYSITVPANSSVSFKTTVKDADGNAVESTVYSFTVDSLEAPQPDTDLFHSITGIRDVPDAATP